MQLIKYENELLNLKLISDFFLQFLPWFSDERQLLGYIVHYMPTPFRNVTMFEGRDACGGDAWTLEDILDNNRNASTVTHILTHLKPYTQYAYYVRTYTVASEQRGGLSPIQYFTTLPHKPEQVTKFKVEQNGSSEIVSHTKIWSYFNMLIKQIYYFFHQ